MADKYKEQKRNLYIKPERKTLMEWIIERSYIEQCSVSELVFNVMDKYKTALDRKAKTK